MMRSCTTTTAAHSSADLIVTDAGHDMVNLRRLVRRAIPMLEHPSDYTGNERYAVAHDLNEALNGTSKGTAAKDR